MTGSNNYCGCDGCNIFDTCISLPYCLCPSTAPTPASPTHRPHSRTGLAQKPYSNSYPHTVLAQNLLPLPATHRLPRFLPLHNFTRTCTSHSCSLHFEPAHYPGSKTRPHTLSILLLTSAHCLLLHTFTRTLPQTSLLLLAPSTRPLFSALQLTRKAYLARVCRS